MTTKALKHYLLLVGFLFVSLGIQGQSEKLYRPKWAIKLNPFALIAYTPGIEVGLEYFMTDRTSLHVGGGYLNDFGFSANKNFDGYKLIGEYRIYNLFERLSINSYGAIQLNYKKVFAQGRTFIDRANGSYQQLTDVSVTNTAMDFIVTGGNVIPFNDWLSLDLSLEFGVRRLNLASDDVSADELSNLFEENFFDLRITEIGTRWYPIYRMQVKVNMVIK